MTSRPILSVNMRKRNAMMHVLLETNVTDDLLCVQEPWFGPIGVNRSDREYEGVDVLGGAAHPNWDIHYPFFTSDERAKVLIYSRKFERGSRHSKLGWRLVVRNDLCRHPSVMIIDLHEGNTCLRVVNVYHDVEDTSSLDTLLSLDLDPTVPTILVGDFNLHSPSWSPIGLTRSPRAPVFENWALAQDLSLRTPQGLITWRGQDGQRDSTLDLTWHNSAVEHLTTISPPLYSWEASLASDHVGVRSYWIPAARSDTANSDGKSFHLQLDDQTQEAWCTSLASNLPPLWPDLPDTFAVDAAALELQTAIERACHDHMHKARRATAHAHRWWNEECAALAAQLRNHLSLADADWEEGRRLAAELKRVTRRAKRTWADHVVTTGDLWDVAGWRHGRRMSRIAALRTSTGDLTFDPAEMAELLADRFFTKDSGSIDTRQDDDPPPRQTRPLVPLTKDELERCLKKTKNDSAPGFSGESWGILKLAWEHIGDHITTLANACLTLGYHPTIWRCALVVVIPKPGRDDYALPKNYRPISLLECLSKLVEKAVSKRMLHDIDAYSLIRTTQFGTRAHSSTLDAGLSLVHDVQTAWRYGLKCGALLFDIKGFFDNVHKDRLAAILRNLGFPESMCSWTLSFLTDRRVQLTFNGEVTPEQPQPVGTPQGSPLSPVLSALYTSPLLELIHRRGGTSLGMYVDDGLLCSIATDYATVSRRLQDTYVICDEWLRRNNLSCEAAKTELIFFRGCRLDDPPTRLELFNTSTGEPFVIHPAATIRYLGFFVNHKLDWSDHVDTMCNRARASLKALQMLGNSHRGLSMANWRLVFNAICLPVLSYGCQLWSTARNYTGLVQRCQLVFNQGVKVISGAFRTAPRETLHELTRVLPARHFFDKLTHTSALRLLRVPRSSQLLARLRPDWPAPAPLHPVYPAVQSRLKEPPPTVLEALGSRVPPNAQNVDVIAVAPWDVPIWQSRLNYMGPSRPQDRRRWVDDLYRSTATYDLVILNVAQTISARGRFDDLRVGASSAVLYSSQAGISHSHVRSWCLGTEVMPHDTAMFGLAKAVEWLNNFFANGRAPPSHVYILSSSSSALDTIRNPRSLSNQREHLLFHSALTAFCVRHRDTGLTLVWSPASRNRIQDTTARTHALRACTVPPRASLNRVQSAAHSKAIARERAFRNWAREWQASRRKHVGRDSFAYEYAIPDPPNGKNHPLWHAATMTITHPTSGRRVPLFSRHTTSTAFRLAVGHAFTSEYTRRFRPDLDGDDLACPCGFPDHSFYHIVYDCRLHSRVRVEVNPNMRWASKPPDFFLSTSHGGFMFCDFLQRSRAAFKPPNETCVLWDPG